MGGLSDGMAGLDSAYQGDGNCIAQGSRATGIVSRSKRVGYAHRNDAAAKISKAWAMRSEATDCIGDAKRGKD